MIQMEFPVPIQARANCRGDGVDCYCSVKKGIQLSDSPNLLEHSRCVGINEPKTLATQLR